MPHTILCQNCGSGNVDSKYIWDEDGTVAIQVNCKICSEVTVIRESRKYKRPRVLAEGKDLERPSDVPGGRPCYPPAPGSR